MKDTYVGGIGDFYKDRKYYLPDDIVKLLPKGSWQKTCPPWEEQTDPVAVKLHQLGKDKEFKEAELRTTRNGIEKLKEKISDNRDEGKKLQSQAEKAKPAFEAKQLQAKSHQKFAQAVVAEADLKAAEVEAELLEAELKRIDRDIKKLTDRKRKAAEAEAEKQKKEAKKRAEAEAKERKQREKEQAAREAEAGKKRAEEDAKIPTPISDRAEAAKKAAGKQSAAEPEDKGNDKKDSTEPEKNEKEPKKQKDGKAGKEKK